MRSVRELLMPPDIRGHMRLPLDQVKEANWIAAYLTKHRKNPKWGQKKENTPRDNKIGMLAEFAQRHAYGMPPWTRHTYPPVGERHMGDVGDNCEVRGHDVPTGVLYLHDEDAVIHAKRDFALIIYHMDYKDGDLFRPAGWIPMRIACKDWTVYDYHKDPRRKCWQIFQNQLLFADCLTITENGRAYMLRLNRFVAP